MADKYTDAIKASNVTTNDEEVKMAVEKILSEHLEENMNSNVWEFLFNTIDLTTLKSTDSPVSVSNFVERVNAFDEEYPQYKNVAAICVYPNFAQVVSTVLDVSNVNVACVAGCFPSSQSFIEVKVAETALAVDGGADEIDIVFNLGNYFDGDYEEVCDEIIELKHAARDARLKVILETGALRTAENIRNASILSLYSGADFLKTSTGKEFPGASPEAAYIMAQCIKEYYDRTGTMVGFKASGGVATTRDAVVYYTIIKEVLGERWLTNEYFRLGASRLANNLLSDMTGKEVKFF
ncbi:MAG: deoxyribose-phosphate aldolase [Muribaculaceae bacterium]|nr:deoxyribose-phosphate aldolase [Muribaculaceae bacterium]